MSRMLTFHDAAWASARNCAAAGRRADALAFLAPLLSSPDAPPRLVRLAHRLAGRLHAATQDYRMTRKHLLAAAKLDPNCAEVHYELGLAFERDPYGCDHRAARRFRKAVALLPKEPRYAAALGRAGADEPGARRGHLADDRGHGSARRPGDHGGGHGRTLRCW